MSPPGAHGAATTPFTDTEQGSTHPYDMYAPPAQRTSGMAVASLSLGVGGLCVLFFFTPLAFLTAILAMVFGGLGIAQCNQDPMLGGKGMAVAGLVLGAVQAGLAVLLGLFVAAVFRGVGGF